MPADPLPWQTLAPGDLPTAKLRVEFEDGNLIRDLAGFEFAGFVRRGSSACPLRGDEERASFVSPNLAESQGAGRNHYGTLYTIAVDRTSVRFEEYSYGGDCQRTAMEILRRLVVELGRNCRWEAHSEYYDSGEYSGPRAGTQDEIRALFSAVPPPRSRRPPPPGLQAADASPPAVSGTMIVAVILLIWATYTDSPTLPLVLLAVLLGIAIAVRILGGGRPR
jgi:hypothetical protein